MNYIRFFETETQPRQEQLQVHVPHSGKPPAHSPYWEQRIIWTLLTEVDTNSYSAETISEEEEDHVCYQEIPITLLQEINGIDCDIFKNQLNITNCFAFDYIPAESDNLMLQTRYVYAAIKKVPRPYRRGIEMASFTFCDGQWDIDSVYIQRAAKKHRNGIVEIKNE